MDDGLEHLVGFRNLRDLDLSHSRITDAGVERLAGLTGLQTLALGPDVTDACLEFLAGMKQLEELRLARSHVSDGGLQIIATLTGLKSLDLSHTLVTDDGLPNLRSLTNCRVWT